MPAGRRLRRLPATAFVEHTARDGDEHGRDTRLERNDEDDEEARQAQEEAGHQPCEHADRANGLDVIEVDGSVAGERPDVKALRISVGKASAIRAG